MKKKFLYILLIITPVFAGVFFILPIDNYLSDATSLDNARILVVEGWMEEKAYPYIIKEFRKNNYDKLVVTGFASNDYFMMGQNGCLSFVFDEKECLQENDQIECNLFGSKVRNTYSRFFIECNGVITDTLEATRKQKQYVLRVKERVCFDSMLIWFINDALYQGQDRNLHVKSLRFNEKMISVNQSSVTYYIKPNESDTRFRLGETKADVCANNLIYMGLDPKTVLVSPSYKMKRFSRTYTAAYDCYELLKQHKLEEGLKINIISRGIHCKRTGLSFKRVFKENAEIGMIDLNKKFNLPPKSTKKESFIEIILLVATFVVAI